MTVRKPRVGDIYLTPLGYMAELIDPTDPGPFGSYSVRFGDGSLSRRWLRVDDILVSYMPDPTIPQVGDRFSWNDATYVITEQPSHYGADSSKVTYLDGKEKGNSFCWTVGSMDEPVRTSYVQPASTHQYGPAVDVKPVGIFGPPVIVKGNVVAGTGKSWPVEKRVTVEWVGDIEFGGLVTYPGNELDAKRRTFGFRPEACLGWKLWTAPKPVEPPKPVVQDWKVTTAYMPPKRNEAYVDLKADSLVMKATFDHNTPSPVIRSVKPLEPVTTPRIRTVWREPLVGEQYLALHNPTLVVDCLEKYLGSRRVLVVE